MELTSDQKMFIILDELKKTLYIDPVTRGDPTKNADIETRFKKVDAADNATNALIKPHRAPFHHRRRLRRWQVPRRFQRILRRQT
jgi:phage terminase large subunit-like protein